LEPYLLYVLFQSNSNPGLADAGSVAYALDVGGMFLVQAGLAQTIVKEFTSGPAHSRAIHPGTLRRFKSVVKLDMIVGALFVVSALPVFWFETPLGYFRFFLWYSSFVFFGFIREGRRPMGNE
jgi:hypothetical protein